MSKKLDEKQARRREQERRQAEQRSAAIRRNLVTIIVAVVVVAAVAMAVLSERETTGADVGVALADAGCSVVEETEALEGAHIKEGAAHEDYNSDPPSSGPHYEVPADPAFYTDAVEPERVVHNLEHGQVVLWYSPEATDEQKDWIDEIVSDQPAATVAVPYEISDGVIAMSAWLGGEGGDAAAQGVLQTCEEVSQAAIDQFRRDYQGKGPEPLTPPFTG